MNVVHEDNTAINDMIPSSSCSSSMDLPINAHATFINDDEGNNDGSQQQQQQQQQQYHDSFNIYNLQLQNLNGKQQEQLHDTRHMKRSSTSSDGSSSIHVSHIDNSGMTSNRPMDTISHDNVTAYGVDMVHSDSNTLTVTVNEAKPTLNTTYIDGVVTAKPSPDSLRTLAEQKERELHDINEFRNNALQGVLSQREAELCQERELFLRLKEDFSYNLRLLEERDRELDRYDTVFSELKAVVSEKEAEISEVKVHADNISGQLQAQCAQRDEVILHIQRQLQDEQSSRETLRWKMDQEIQQIRAEYDMQKRELARKLDSAQEDLDMQRRELTVQFEDSMKRVEREYGNRETELKEDTLSLRRQLSQQAQDLDRLHAEVTTRANNIESLNAQLQKAEKKVREVEWAEEDASRQHAAAAIDAQAQLTGLRDTLKSLSADYKARESDMEAELKRQEQLVIDGETALKVAASEHAAAERELRHSTEEAKSQWQKSMWDLQDRIKIVERERDESRKLVSNFQSDIEHTASLHSHEISVRDTELRELREKLERSRKDILERKRELEELRQELAAGVDRLNEQQRKALESDLNWGKRFEELERSRDSSNATLYRKLIQQADNLRIELRDRDSNISELRDLLQSRKQSGRQYNSQKTRMNNNDLESEFIAEKKDLHSPVRSSKIISSVADCGSDPDNNNDNNNIEFDDNAHHHERRGVNSRNSNHHAWSPSQSPSSRMLLEMEKDAFAGFETMRSSISTLSPKHRHGSEQAWEDIPENYIMDVSRTGTDEFRESDSEMERLRNRVSELSAQNSRLREAVGSMRREMENLASERQTSDKNHTDDLQRQIRELKALNESLLTRISSINEEGDKKFDSLSLEDSLAQHKDLLDSLDSLRRDKAKLTNRVESLTSQMAAMRSRCFELDECLKSAVEGHTANTKALEDQLANLRERLHLKAERVEEAEESLVESRRMISALSARLVIYEGDNGISKVLENGEVQSEHHVAVIHKLQVQIGQLHRELSDRSNDIEHLEKRLHAKRHIAPGASTNVYDENGIFEENQSLRTKLLSASAEIRRLVMEREKLMEISNMLKADLAASMMVAPFHSEQDDAPWHNNASKVDLTTPRRANSDGMVSVKYASKRNIRSPSKHPSTDGNLNMDLSGMPVPTRLPRHAVSMTEKMTAGQTKVSSQLRQQRNYDHDKSKLVRNWNLKH